MTRLRTSVTLSIGAVLLLPLLAVSSCSTEAPTSPGVPIDAARAAPTTAPTVTATDPDTGFRSTTIDVRVIGSGFDAGSRAIWGLKGDTTFATTRIKTNSTRYVKSTELVASITIAADAPLDRFDVVVVTSKGKKGIGIERFTVTYQIVDLGTLGGLRSVALAVNDLNQVVGWSETATGERHAFLWTEATGMRDLGTLGAAPSEARGINNAGEVVGFSATPSVWRRGFRWTATGGMQPFDPLFSNASEIFALNSNGEVAGWADTIKSTGTFRHPTIWTGQGRESLGDRFAEVRGLNTVGQAVGYVSSPVGSSPPPIAALWTRSGSVWNMQELFPRDGRDSQAGDINELGEVVGAYRRGTGGYVGFVRASTGAIDTVTPLVAGANTNATAINDNGLVAGFSYGSSSNFRSAVLWSRIGETGWKIRELPVLRQGDSEALAINARGEMAGYSSLPRSAVHAVLWRLQ